MKVTIEELEAYLLDHYSNGGIDQSLFMKLVEEIGEVAEVLNKKAGRKKSGSEDLQAQLGNELADVIHYAIAIAALNDLDMNQIIIEKDKASIGMLQRMFKIGFNRAARIMDQLADAGVVSGDEGTKARTILMSKEQFENYLEENG